MPEQNEASAVIQKTRELCEAILQEPGMSSARARITAFSSDPQAQTDYEALVSKGQTLQDKQQRSIPLTDEEIADFEAHRERVLGNPVARGFLDAQQAIQEVRHSVNKYVSMTLETGRVPTPEDFEGASCGHGCNCH
jgi:cell fate (sporulation/competence/biofilm development) regulator YlbF (YheA/YmcA/DUF963 family)